MNAKHTHRGHCQACGAVQAAQIHDGKIAKHGYNVKSGHFVGTCSGSGERPLELDRSYTDAFAATCDRNAEAHDKAAGELAAGVRIPARCSYGQKWDATAGKHGRGAYVEQWKSWDESDDYHRRGQVQREIAEHTQHADFLRNHAKRLRELAERVHGQPLRPVETKPVTLVTVGAKFRNGEHEYEVTRTNVCGGMGMRAIYTEVKQLSNGRTFRMSTASVRRRLEEGKAPKQEG